MIEPPKGQYYMVAGRRVSDYEACGNQAPIGHQYAPCRLCGTTLLFSPEALMRIRTDTYAVAICTPCLRSIVDKKGAGTIVPLSTSFGRESGTIDRFLREYPDAKKDL